MAERLMRWGGTLLFAVFVVFAMNSYVPWYVGTPYFNVFIAFVGGSTAIAVMLVVAGR